MSGELAVKQDFLNELARVRDLEFVSEVDVSAPRGMTRLRSLMLEMIFSSEFKSEPWFKNLYFIELLYEERIKDEVKTKLVRDVCDYLTNNGELVDSLIEDQLEHKNIDHVALVDRCILRLALAEMAVRPSLPPAILVNEAVKLATIFNGDVSAKFINGVLRSYTHKLVTQQIKTAQEGD